MASELQRIVDGIANQLQRAAAIDDPQLRLQVYSPHVGQVDQVRLDSILHREAPSVVRDWVLSLGIASAEGPFRIGDPPDDLGAEMLARVGAPIRCQGVHLGYLWIIDAEGSTGEEELSALQEAADAAGVVMYRERLVDELQRTQQRALLRDLLTGELVERQVAAAQAVEDRTFAPGPAMAVVVEPRPAEGPVGELHRVALEQAVGACHRGHEGGRVLGLVRADHAVVVVSAAESRVRRQGPRHIAEQLRSETLARHMGDEDRVVVGIGGVVDELVDLPGSYEEARRAVRVATAVPSFGDIAAIEDIGVYGLVTRLPEEALTPDLLPATLRRLMDGDADGTLLTTLETYLDLSGDAQATAKALVIHRTSLYYRLRRVREISGADLSTGDDRLALHLGLKVARFLGLW